MSLNPDLSAEGIAIAGKMVRNCEIGNLNISWCKLDAEKLQQFRTQLQDAKIRTLDMQETVDLVTKEEMEAIHDLMPNVSEEICLHGWNFSCSQQILLQSWLDGLSTDKLHIIFCALGKNIVLAKTAGPMAESGDIKDESDTQLSYLRRYEETLKKRQRRKQHAVEPYAVKSLKVAAETATVVEVGDVTVEFPAGAVSVPVETELALYPPAEDNLGHMAITPIFECKWDTDVKLQKEVNIRIPNHFLFNQEQFRVYVFRKDEGGRNCWDEIETRLLQKEVDTLEFSVKQFSKLGFFVRLAMIWLSWSRDMTFSVYYDDLGNFIPVFSLCNKAVKRIHKRLSESQYHPMAVEKMFEVKYCDMFTITFDEVDGRFDLSSVKKPAVFHVDKLFIKRSHARDIKFSTKPLPKRGDTATIGITVERQEMALPWKDITNVQFGEENPALPPDPVRSEGFLEVVNHVHMLRIWKEFAESRHGLCLPLSTVEGCCPRHSLEEGKQKTIEEWIRQAPDSMPQTLWEKWRKFESRHHSETDNLRQEQRIEDVLHTLMRQGNFGWAEFARVSHGLSLDGGTVTSICADHERWDYPRLFVLEWMASQGKAASGETLRRLANRFLRAQGHLVSSSEEESDDQ